MKQIFVNLKRFDIPVSYGGVNRIAPVGEWGASIVRETQRALARWPDAAFTFYLPEAHILGAAAARSQHSPVRIGCQSVLDADTAPGGNFGAFTSSRTANAARALGCESVIIGHCEERRHLAAVMAEARAADAGAVSRILNRQAACAQASGLHVLFCVGETAEQRGLWRETLAAQISEGLRGLNPERLSVAYEPVWAIGPGRTPPDRETIRQAAAFIKAETAGVPLVYGGGLKTDNAAMLATIPEIDGGLVALTRFAGEIGFYPAEFIEIVGRYMEVGA